MTTVLDLKALLALLNEKDSKAVRETLSKLRSTYKKSSELFKLYLTVAILIEGLSLSTWQRLISVLALYDYCIDDTKTSLNDTGPFIPTLMRQLEICIEKRKNRKTKSRVECLLLYKLLYSLPKVSPYFAEV